MNHLRREIKKRIIGAGYTMKGALAKLEAEYGWSGSQANLTGKLERGTMRYYEAIELADVLGYDVVWVNRRTGDQKNDSVRLYAGQHKGAE